MENCYSRQLPVYAIENFCIYSILGDYHTAMRQAMNAFGRAMTSGPIEIRARHLDALAELLNVPTTTDAADREQLMTITKAWYQALCDDPTAMIVDLYRKPFFEVHMAAGNIIRILCSQPWAVKMFAQLDG